jgi:hypothetical protein
MDSATEHILNTSGAYEPRLLAALVSEMQKANALAKRNNDALVAVIAEIQHMQHVVRQIVTAPRYNTKST